MGVLKRSIRDVWRRKARALLVILALGISISIVIAIPAGTNAVSKLGEEAIATQGSSYQSIINMTASEIIVGPPETSYSQPGGSGFGGFGGGFRQMFRQGTINESIVENVANMSGVTAVVPELSTMIQLPSSSSQTSSQPFARFNFLRVSGIPLNSSLDEQYGIQPADIVTGSKLSDQDSHCVLLGLNLTSTLNTAVGQKVTLQGSQFQVVGVFDSGNTFGNRLVYMSLADAQNLFNQTGQVSQIRVYANSVSDVTNIIDNITSTYGDAVSATTQTDLNQRIPQQYASIQSQVTAQLDQATAVSNQEMLIAIIMGALIVFFTMTYAVRERTKEIGILKALGFAKRHIVSQFMIEGLIIGLVGGIAGAVFGTLGAPILSNILIPHLNISRGFLGGRASSTVNITPAMVAPNISLVLLGFSIAVLLGVVGSLYPAWWASRKNPSEALRYE